MMILFQSIKKRWTRPLLVATIVFSIAAVAAAAGIWRVEQYRLQEARTRLQSLAGDHAVALKVQLEPAFSATYALAALVSQGNGEVRNFEEVAKQLLPFYPGVAALELAPRGVVRNVVPLRGNEQAIGHDLLQDPVRNHDAFFARDTGKLTFAGPFNLLQGGLGAAARLPVFLEGTKGEEQFWGFTIVLIRLPESLAPAQLSLLAHRGIAYELWRIQPDTNQKQIIAASSSAPLKEPVLKSVELPNGTWTLSVAPVGGWGDRTGLFLKVMVGLLFSLLLGWLAKLLMESKAQEARLEALVAERTAEILESEERLRLLADNLPDSYIYQYLQENGTPRFLELSAGVERLHAVNRQGVLHDAGTLYRQMDPAQLSEFRAAEDDSKANMTDFQMEVRMRRPDGMYRWMQLRSRPRLRSGGRVVWDGVATDITTRKQTEEALRHERDFSDAALNSLPSVFYMFDKNLKFLRWNRRFEQVLGYAHEEIIGLSPLDLVTEEDRERAGRLVREAFEAGALEVEMNFLAKDGTYKPYYFTGVTTRIGYQDCLLGVGIDITERKLAEKALEEAHLLTVQQKNFLEAVMEALPVGVAIINAQGELIQANNAFKEIWGGSRPLTRAYAVQEVWWIETGQPVQPEELASATALLKDEKVTGQLLKIERGDGIPTYIHNNATPFHDNEGRIAGCAVAVMDITEQIKTKESLRLAKDAAEAANSAKSHFLANMSHELRTPMSGILGMLELALEEDLSPATREHLQATLNSARSLLRILNDILDMTNVMAGRLSIVKKRFLLSECIAGAVAIINFEAQRKGLEIVVAVADDVPDSVTGDQVRLRQVLLNLLANAVKFTSKGKIQVRITVSGATSERNRLITFAVIDTGIGIPESNRDMIFRAFSQVDASYSRSFGGIGLGLAISGEIVRLMGGTISFESTEGRGSSFFFTVPLEQSGSEADAINEVNLEATVPGLKDLNHLLVAEDDPAIRGFLGKMLERSQFIVDVAEDGLEAVEKWEKGSYHLVLMDIQMPRLNGLDATRAIREKEKKRGGHTPIVAVTAHAFKEDEERCLAAGMDGYISKPIEFKKSLELIRDMIKARYVER